MSVGSISFIERNHKVETFSTSTADQALTKCIRLRAFVRSLQHGQPERLQQLIEFLRIDSVAVMDNESETLHRHSRILETAEASTRQSDVE
jgi:hypothetical protein